MDEQERRDIEGALKKAIDPALGNHSEDLRLRAALQQAQCRLSALFERVQRPGLKDIAMEATCRQAAQCYQRAVAEAKPLRRCRMFGPTNRRFVAWDNIFQFDHVMLGSLTDEERAVHWVAMCAEAELKLSDWRKATYEALMKRHSPGPSKEAWSGGGPGAKVPDSAHPLAQAPAQPPVQPAAERPKPTCGPPTLAALRTLHRQLTENSQNTQYKIHLLQQSSGLVAWMLGGVVALALLFAAYSDLPALASALGVLEWVTGLKVGLIRWNTVTRLLALGIVGGAIGGMVSTAFWLGRVNVKGKIPELQLTRTITSMRPALGAVAAIPVVLLVHQKFLTLKGLDVPATVFILSLVAGFSERWFLGLMGRFESRER
jgi:hypothetical protein